jgi:GWxTD domain-containing protein
VPAVIGFLKPVILVPAGLLAGLPAEQLEGILAHELAHIRRCDYLVNLAQSLVEGLLYYHPAVWWVSSVVRAERENCCDDVAVAVSGDARGYAAALANLEESRWTAPETALAASGGDLMKRIRRLLEPKEGPRPAGAPVLGAAVLIVGLGVALFGWQSKPNAAAPVQASPYQKWLKEDVAYIINDRERAAFESLQTDAEREKFIEQFWERRDPTPGTVENEFKEEHYRRIAYANEHYTSDTMPGWKTDRGRIYIVYGPPDEIESHPSGDPATGKPPYEQWLYRYIEGVGKNVIMEFDDAGGKGVYRMTRDPHRKQ